MAETRFNSDSARQIKHLQQQTDGGRYMLNMPGPGDNPCFIEDPQIILQKWGANIMTNSTNIESELFNVNRTLSRDCLGKDQYQKFNFNTQKIQYPNCGQTITSESRTTHPAWLYKDLEQVDWYYPPLNPQENTCMPFLNNINTRVIEKDNFIASCNLSNNNINTLLSPVNLSKK